MSSAIAYFRVSTQRQGRSGLGIEAQRLAVTRFAEAEGIAILQEFTEVETGKGPDAIDRSPRLAEALAAARKERCQCQARSALARRAFIAGLCQPRSLHRGPSLAPTPIPSCSTSLPRSPRRCAG
jgi:DNA invertase Pin-like site-specific DNA recombinase